MKKVLFTFLISLVSVSSFASHLHGGELHWRCLANGTYQFYMSVNRDCGGVRGNSDLREKSIEISGSPLPTDGQGNTISTISMRFDTTRWLNNAYGVVGSSCMGELLDTNNCYNGNGNGYAIQQFYWVSDSIVLKGIPPDEGWIFASYIICCLPTNYENVNTPGVDLDLRAEMYPDFNRNNANPCLYSSPEFAAPPTISVCRGQIFSYSNLAIHKEQDSLSYRWGKITFSSNQGSEELTYIDNYNYDNPTSDKTFDSLNLPSSLNGTNGQVQLRINNGIGLKKFLLSLQVDAWKAGVKLSSTYREYQISVLDCDNLLNGNQNNTPKVYLNKVQQNLLEFDALIGERFTIPIRVIDEDTLESDTSFQNITIKPNGLQFATNFTDNQNCSMPPCATLSQETPLYDSLFETYIIQKEKEVNTIFEWQTDSSLLGARASRFFHFNYSVQDDHCPIPGSSSAVISIRLHKDGSSFKAKMNCLEKKSNGTLISWDSNNIRSYGFDQWMIYSSEYLDSNYILIDSIANFSQNSYLDIQANGQDKYYTIKAKGTINNTSFTSQPSDTIHSDKVHDISISNGVLQSISIADSYQWYDCNKQQIIAGETSSSYEPVDTGNYAVIIKFSTCTDTSECFFFNPLGIEEYNFQKQFSYFPNPTNGNVKIISPLPQ